MAWWLRECTHSAERMQVSETVNTNFVLVLASTLEQHSNEKCDLKRDWYLPATNKAPWKLAQPSFLCSTIGTCEPVITTVLPRSCSMYESAEAVYAMVSVPAVCGCSDGTTRAVSE
jgi:hypothetical protein